MLDPQLRRSLPLFGVICFAIGAGAYVPVRVAYDEHRRYVQAKLAAPEQPPVLVTPEGAGTLSPPSQASPSQSSPALQASAMLSQKRAPSAQAQRQQTPPSPAGIVATQRQRIAAARPIGRSEEREPELSERAGELSARTAPSERTVSARTTLPLDVPPAGFIAAPEPRAAPATPLSVAASIPQGSTPATGTGVFVNHRELPLEAVVSLQMSPGRYWYDPTSGLWGLEGTGPAGMTTPGMPVQDPLPADASRGATGVFINGRNITSVELVTLVQLVGTLVPPGRYALDGMTNFGPEGGPFQHNIASRVAALQAMGALRGTRSGASGQASRFGRVTAGGGVVGYQGPNGLSATCGADGCSIMDRRRD